MRLILKEYFSLVKKYIGIILILSFFYSAQMIFPVTGPILKLLVNDISAQLMSAWGLLVLVLSLFFQPKEKNQYKSKNYYLITLVIITSACTSVFYVLPVVLQWILLALFGFTIGRFVYYWSRIFVTVPKTHRGQVIGTCLFFTYGVLYLSNALVPSLPKAILPLIPALLLLASITCYTIIENRENSKVFEAECDELKINIPMYFFILITIVFITAGATYGYVYPLLEKLYWIERFYNVLPFVIVVPFAGIIADKLGRKYLIYIGISFLGLSFAFTNLEVNLLSYFLVQNTLQPGWAFVDTYVWVMAADISYTYKNTKYLLYGPACLVLGTALGQIVTYFMIQASIEYSLIISFISHLPLFFAVALLSRIPETLLSKSDLNEENLNNIMIPYIDTLSEREKEVALYLLKNYSNSEIGETLHISISTVKTHSTRIYKKLNVSSKKQLRELFSKYNKTS